ncbi:hypothetical protein GUITHDRAFT_119804 [Guillardia theta CCMP2712]|uniref:Uncharacterized protein n=1 Tax=Guillardia theta (strain CCMP2712) TaxID=905079 RepID=L1IDL4_GUITC|nr:hypothetical protein GUITHDRAFT_119804 [Guillardia theta CCMP2712]EKX34004.1 hypothetical protein GUITHDRAFT_119804 [Guillardia theta CCMP2712]|eukprot:XP_005820984.1 hypothetical protein GUITHDRAFT_119804 [Guillardia theta CCMP2712]
MGCENNKPDELAGSLRQDLFFHGRDVPSSWSPHPPKTVQAVITVKGSLKLKNAKEGQRRAVLVEGGGGLLLGNIVEAARKARVAGRSFESSGWLADHVEKVLSDKGGEQK